MISINLFEETISSEGLAMASESYFFFYYGTGV
jgi:hypothetical protein